MKVMKCKMDLVRDIMLFAENFYPMDHYDEKTRVGTRSGRPEYSDFPQYAEIVSEEEFYTTLNMLYKKDYLVPKDYKGYIFTDPTWEGHLFLNEIRDPKWFEKIKKKVGNRPWTIDTIRYTHKQMQKARDNVVQILLISAINWIVMGVLGTFTAIAFGIIFGVGRLFGFF